MRDLLSVLHEHAGVAEARGREVDEEVTLQVIALANFDALEQGGQPPAAAVGGAAEEQALRDPWLGLLSHVLR